MGQKNIINKAKKLNDKLYFGDWDSNGYKEVYGFTLRVDSLFLNMIEPLSPKEPKKTIFITEIQPDNSGVINCSCEDLHTVDLNEDGFKEIVFPVVTGFGLAPRAIYAFDMYNEIVLSSASVGSPSAKLSFEDLDGNNQPEIICNSGRLGNVKENHGIPYSDDRPWLKVYKADLTFLFPPVPFPPGAKANIFCLPDTFKSKKRIVVLNKNTGIDSCFISLFNSSGKEIKRTELKLFNNETGLPFFKEENRYLVYNGSVIFYYSKGLELIEHKELKYEGIQPTLIDIDENGKNELIVKGADRKSVIIYSDNYKHYNVLEFSDRIVYNSDYMKIEKNKFYLITEHYTFNYSYAFNPLYYFKFPAYIFIYLISVAFIFFIQLIQKKQLTEKYELKNQLRELELKNVQNQMDPHFMFNAFTTMASLLKKGQQDEAYNGFMKFSKLIRSNFDFSNNITRPLQEELQAVTNFLEINKMRFKEKLEYSFDIDKDIPQKMQVPKMMLQMHVENALKHGVAKLNKTGKITVKIIRKNNFAEFIIEDNGIGRKKAAGLKRPSTRQGLKMLQAIYERLNQKNKVKIRQRFNDLLDKEGNAAGTRVEINVPIGLKD